METLAHQIRLVPTPFQEEYFRKACGTARFVWNWALSESNRRYEGGEKVDGLKLKKEFNARKAVDFPWTYEVTKYASQQPFLHLQAAFRRFFEKKARYPRFKRKGVHDSFYIGGDHIEVSGRRIRIPRLGWVRMREEVRFRGKVVSATVRRIADRWFVSVQVELEDSPVRCESQACIGVDLGVNRLATLSNGATFEGPKPLRQQLKRLRRWSHRLSRRQKGSNNRDKARRRLARLHYRIRCIRQDGLHKLTSYLTENFGVIAIEELNVRGMLQNRRLARALSDMGFHEFRRQPRLQDPNARQSSRSGGPMVRILQNLLGMWIGERGVFFGRASVSLPGMRFRIGPRPECGAQFIAYGELHRISSLWRGRLWLQLTLG